MFYGPMVAIVTPFRQNEIDEPALRRLINFQIENGTTGIIACGTTGEATTLSDDEWKRVISITVDEVKGRVPVIAGSGTNNTQKSITKTRIARELGAAGALCITPYYNKPTQAGMLQHFSAIANAVDIPIILYNVPGRTGVSITPETVAELSRFKNIVGIKEATGQIGITTEILMKTNNAIKVYSGDDFTTFPLFCVGASGVISVVSNIAPDLMRKLYDATMKNDLATARVLHEKVYTLSRALFIETNPIPVKYALHLMGMIELELRLPLCPPSETTRTLVKNTLKSCELL